jgi:hypothetical protein
MQGDISSSPAKTLKESMESQGLQLHHWLVG